MSVSPCVVDAMKAGSTSILLIIGEPRVWETGAQFIFLSLILLFKVLHI